jgi:hypothetical protein
MSTIPPATSPIWADLVSGRRAATLEFLAAKILLARLRLQATNGVDAATLARQLRDLYASNAELPAARRDLTTFEAGGAA